MRRIRVLAAILATLTAAVAGLLWIAPGSDAGVVATCVVGAVCLAIVSPFEALEPPHRKRVLAGCVAFVIAIGVGLALAVFDGTELAPLGALAGLETAGLVLAAWSFAVRNRRRRSAWADYYDR